MKSLTPVAAPSQSSASAARFASLSTPICSDESPIRSCNISTTGTSCQCRFGATSNEPRSMSTSPGSATVAPIGRRPCAWTASSAPRGDLTEPVEDVVDRAAAVVGRLHALVARAAREVGGLDGDVVDVDLQAQRNDAIARHVDHEPGPARRPTVLGTALDQQPELH